MLREEEIMKRQEQPGLDQAKIRCLELHSGPHVHGRALALGPLLLMSQALR